MPVSASSEAEIMEPPKVIFSWYWLISARVERKPRALTRLTGLSEIFDICMPEEIWLLYFNMSVVILFRLLPIML